MANQRITELTELAVEPAVDDVLPLVDLDVLTTKKIKWQTLKLFIPRYIYKSADETVNNSTVLQNDNHLVIPVLATEVIAFELFLYASAPSNVPDFKCGWTVPAGCTMYWNKVTYAAVGGSNLVFTESTTDTDGLDNGVSSCRYYGVIFVGANSGNVQFQWAQNTATAVDVILKKGSNLLFWKLA